MLKRIPPSTSAPKPASHSSSRASILSIFLEGVRYTHTDAGQRRTAVASTCPVISLAYPRPPAPYHLPRTLRSRGGSRVILGMFGVAIFAAIAKLPQKLRR